MKICSYFTCGFPDLESSLKIMSELLEFSDYLEIGIPFTDPIADGPTIQFSSFKALENGFKVDQTFKVAENLSKSGKKILIMTYYNIIFRNKEKFLQNAKDSGVWGIVVPDLLPGEDLDFEELMSKLNLKTVFFVAPNTKKTRIKFIDKHTTGFIYYITVKGITGERERLPDELKQKIKSVKAVAKKEVFAGFGISKKEHIKELENIADGVIIGSAIIRKVIESNNINSAISNIRQFMRELTQ